MPLPAATSTLQIIATSSLIASVTSALINSGWTSWREHRARVVSARMSALTVLGVVETYISDCYGTLDHLDSAEYLLKLVNGDGELAQRFETVPDLPTIPDTVNWHSLRVDGALEIINFQSHVRMSRAAAQLRWSPYLPDAQAKVKQYTARLALEALDLCGSLRDRWDLHGYGTTTLVGIDTLLKERLAGYDEEREAIKRRTDPNDQG